jgi:hypothetical protein
VTSLAVVLAVGLTAQAPAQQISIPGFIAADTAGRLAILRQLGTSRSRVPIETLLELVRIGSADNAPDVRTAAMVAVSVRAIASRWAGTTGPGMGPPPRGTPPPEPPPLIPAEWRTDQATLRTHVRDTCVAMVRGDTHEEVRHTALLAAYAMYLPTDPLAEAFPDEFVSLVIDVYRRDASDRLRSEAVKALRGMTNNSEPIRNVLSDAIVDKARSVRFQGLTSLTPETVGGPTKLIFAEAYGTIRRGTKDNDRAVRLNAVHALRLFGAAATEAVPLLDTVSTADPDPDVRAAARLAADAIRPELAR